MERDSNISHGTSRFMKEKMMESSDKYEVYVCNDCGSFAYGNEANGLYECVKCRNNNKKVSNIVKMEMPYAMKLLYQEVRALGLGFNVRSIESTEEKK